jgi:hypothetical protein
VSQRRPLLPEQRVLPAPSLSESGSSRGCHASREHEPEPKPSRRQEPSQDSLPAWTSVRRGEHADDAAWRSSLPCLQPRCAATVPRTGRSRYRALPSEWLIMFVMLTDRVNHPLPPLLPFRAMKVSRCPVSRDLVHVSLELDQSSACLTQSGPHGAVALFAVSLKLAPRHALSHLIWSVPPLVSLDAAIWTYGAVVTSSADPADGS